MTKAEIDAALERRAAEVCGWRYDFDWDRWITPDGKYTKDECPPDYCSPDAPHSLLRGLLAISLTSAIGDYLLPERIEAFSNALYAACPQVYILLAPPRSIVAACLAALDKLPDGISLKMVRDTEGEG